MVLVLILQDYQKRLAMGMAITISSVLTLVAKKQMEDGQHSKKLYNTIKTIQPTYSGYNQMKIQDEQIQIDFEMLDMLISELYGKLHEYPKSIEIRYALDNLSKINTELGKISKMFQFGE